MGSLRTTFLAGVGAAAGATVYLAYKISQETGRSFTDALTEVPSEAGRYWEELRSRASEAVEAGREAARSKQDEIEQQLREQERQATSSTP